ncbi:ABC transporter substrate-binding protein [Eubacteriaceae bacterium ES2]|nr:ABC transporter substrate-binding protein [Eubacteriaceae bacterium ES2]
MKKIGLLFLLFVLTLVCGCQRSGNQTADQVIDVIYPFSEDYSISFKNGIELAAQEINDNGGILDEAVTINFVDDGDNTNTAVEVATMVAEKQGFPIVIGHRSTDDVLEVEGIYQRNNKILFAPIIASSKISRAENEGAYLVAPSENEQAQVMVEKISAQGISKVVIIHTAGNTYGKDFMQKFEEHARKAGLEIVDAVSYLPTADYFNAYLKKWDAMGAEAIVSACVGSDVTTLFNYLEQTGNTRPIFVTYDIEVQPYEVPISLKSLTQVISYFDAQATEGSQAEFIKAYQEMFGKTPDLSAAQGYFALHLAADAVNQAGSLDVSKIKTVLKDSQFESLYGSVTFDSRLVQGIPVIEKRFVNGQLVTMSN